MADRDTTSERKVDCSSSKEFKGSFKYDNVTNTVVFEFVR